MFIGWLIFGQPGRQKGRRPRVRSTIRPSSAKNCWNILNNCIHDQFNSVKDEDEYCDILNNRINGRSSFFKACDICWLRHWKVADLPIREFDFGPVPDLADSLEDFEISILISCLDPTRMYRMNLSKIGLSQRNVTPSFWLPALHSFWSLQVGHSTIENWWCDRWSVLLQTLPKMAVLVQIWIDIIRDLKNVTFPPLRFVLSPLDSFFLSLYWLRT